MDYGYSPFPFFPFQSIPLEVKASLSLELGPLNPAKGMGSAISLPSGVRGRAPAKNAFSAKTHQVAIILHLSYAIQLSFYSLFLSCLFATSYGE